MFAQEELASVKDTLQQKESEIKQLQEKLVHHMKGEEMNLKDRGKTR